MLNYRKVHTFAHENLLTFLTTMNLFTKISIVLLLTCFVGKVACAQQPYTIVFEQIEVAGNSNKDNSNKHLPSRSPARYTLPLAWYDASAGVLRLEAQSDVAFAYAIKDADGLTLGEDALQLTTGETRTVDVSGLGAGTYTLYIHIGSLAYAGTFEIAAL